MITLSENFRALFYAPFYAAHAIGAYEAEKVEVALRDSPDPARTAAESFPTVPTSTSRPDGSHGEYFAKARQIRKAGGAGRSPIGRKPLAMNSFENRSGFSAAIRRPISDPQS